MLSRNLLLRSAEHISLLLACKLICLCAFLGVSSVHSSHFSSFYSPFPLFQIFPSFFYIFSFKCLFHSFSIFLYIYNCLLLCIWLLNKNRLSMPMNLPDTDVYKSCVYATHLTLHSAHCTLTETVHDSYCAEASVEEIALGGRLD